MKQAPIVLGVAVLTLGILSVVPGSRATEPLDGDANGNATGEPFAADKGLPFLTTENFSFGAVTESSAEAAEADKLAKQLANPISSLISVPFQANEDFGYGPSHNGYKFTLNIQPVIPISISRDWNLILRTIFPIVSQHDLFYVENVPKRLNLPAQNRSQDGLSDTLQSFFFSPEKRGPFGLIWGVGPALLYPTGTHPFLGTGTFSMGPTVVIVKQAGGLTAGGLMNQLWSVAIEEDRKSVSQLYLQPFVAYTMRTHTTFVLSSETTANWNSTPGNAKWTIPLIFQINQILKIGKQPISVQIGGKYYADSPRYGPDWGVRFNLTLLYPKAGPKPGPMAERSGKDRRASKNEFDGWHLGLSCSRPMAIKKRQKSRAASSTRLRPHPRSFCDWRGFALPFLLIPLPFANLVKLTGIFSS